ncbi:MAG: peptide MFS transporter [Bacteroidaceae bacterium]|nr:peptide MFS transporter [Bacteroidaceae bacterium]
MFDNQPKGLYALALANTGERFGYYTMLAIFTLFLQAKFGFTASEASTVYGVFLGFVYFMPLVGGMLADKMGYGKMVTTGIIVMFLGYLFLAVPISVENTWSKYLMYASLFLISCGTGFFKGNLQVMVGNLYDAPQYRNKRDTAFSLFYMAINLGALFAPTAAAEMTGYVMNKADFTYQSNIPALAHEYLDKTADFATEADLLAASAENTRLVELTAEVEKNKVEQNYSGTNAEFCHAYNAQLSKSYHYGFGIACLSLILSMLIYVSTRSTFREAEGGKLKVKSAAEKKEEEISPAETKERIVALLLVFAVVIFFWMAFHQNGLTMTFFARDYTQHSVTGISRLGFDVWPLVLLLVSVYSTFSLFQSKKRNTKIISGGVLAASLAGAYALYLGMDETIHVLPQIFQHFNPFFVVALTPVSLAIFAYLAKKKKEPKAPVKIGIGMFVAAAGFVILAVASFGLPTPTIGGATEVATSSLVSPNWLISTYLVLTFAELLLSPMGISFVSKVAPPKYKGAMMGCWFAATAIGNYLVSVVGYLWGHLPLWMVWGVLVLCCTLSALFIFSIIKKLNKVA